MTNTMARPMQILIPHLKPFSLSESVAIFNFVFIGAAREFVSSPKTFSHRRRCRCRNGKCSRRGRRRLSLAYSLQFLAGRDGQAAFAVEQFLQPPVAGTRFAPDDFGRNTITQFAAVTPPFQPVFVAD